MYFLIPSSILVVFISLKCFFIKLLSNGLKPLCGIGPDLVNFDIELFFLNILFVNFAIFSNEYTFPETALIVPTAFNNMHL